MVKSTSQKNHYINSFPGCSVEQIEKGVLCFPSYSQAIWILIESSAPFNDVCLEDSEPADRARF